MERVLFGNPVVPEVGQPFTTVRLGGKWAGRVKAGDRVELAVAKDQQVFGFGEVLGAATCKFKELTQAVLDLEHDPACRTKDGLQAAMKRAYGDDFKTTANVTVLTIKVLGVVEDGPEPEPEGAEAASEYAQELDLNYSGEAEPEPQGQHPVEPAADSGPILAWSTPPKDATDAARRAVGAAQAILDHYFGRKGKPSRRPRAIAYQQAGKRLLDLSSRITS